MQNEDTAEHAAYEWQPHSILFPRIGVILSRSGPKTRLIMPGRYMVRRSRSLGQWIYRSRAAG